MGLQSFDSSKTAIIFIFDYIIIDIVKQRFQIIRHFTFHTFRIHYDSIISVIEFPAVLYIIIFKEIYWFSKSENIKCTNKYYVRVFKEYIITSHWPCKAVHTARPAP